MHPEIDRFAHLSSPIHSWDPRFKLFSFFLFILTTSLVQSWLLIMVCFAVSVFCLLLSKIPLSFVFMRLRWVVFFLLPFFIILPLTTPGASAFSVFTLHVTYEGLRQALLIYLRALTIVMIIFPAFGTASFELTMKSLQELKVPGILVQMILLTYRYIFVFIEEVRLLQTAMKARGFIKRSNWFSLRTMGNFIGTLLIRSFDKTERLYQAMQARGFDGKIRACHVYQAKPGDYLKSTLMLAVCVIILYGGTL